ncbi:ATPase (plasmid) [Thermus sp. PS18]|uniref:ATPase n=1 Tax=Thermus sp. PS18 TaxID=2849039 RepID=UPI002265699F|nr:ATPase [Thermus sp. PS18]UZX16808.1 ATPase [Thermus sp. PS18]
MKRRRLAELVREEAGVLREAPPEAGVMEEAPTPPEEKPGEAPPAQASPEGEGRGERPLPPYLTYVRKECRLRPDQLDALTALARRLNRERKGKGERITENTLIRLAVDKLLKSSYREVAEMLGRYTEEGGQT